jgi:hypothetical protein
VNTHSEVPSFKIEVKFHKEYATTIGLCPGKTLRTFIKTHFVNTHSEVPSFKIEVECRKVSTTTVGLCPGQTLG